MRRATPVVLLVALAAAIVVGVSLAMRDAPRTRAGAEITAASPPATQPKPRRRVADEAPVPAVAAEPTDDLDLPRATGRVLRLVDAAGVPVADTWVYGPGGARETTDRHGEVGFPPSDPPPDVAYFDGVRRRRIALHDAVTEVKVGALPRLGVEVVDGSTGEAVRGVRARARREFGEWTDVSAEGSGAALTVNDIGWAKAEVEVTPPPGFGAFAPFDWSGAVASRARDVRVRVPIWPERPIALKLVGDDGCAVAGAKAARFRTSLRGIHRRLEVTHGESVSDADGILRITGVPAVPYCRLDFEVGRLCDDDRNFEFGASVKDVRLDGPVAAEPTRVVLVRRPFEGAFGSGIGSSSSSCGERKREGARAPLVVRAFHRDGLEASRVRLWIGDLAGETDDDGTCRFENAQIGPHDLTACAHGFLAAVVRVDVGAVSEVVVREPSPRTVRVEVVDESDRPLPAACVTSECRSVVGPSGADAYVGCSVAQLDGDVELATPLTGADGSVNLQEPAGTIRYRVVLGGAREEVESAADFVRVALHAPKD